MHHIDGFVQDCSFFIAKAQEIHQSFTKPSIYGYIQAKRGSKHVGMRKQGFMPHIDVFCGILQCSHF